MTSVFNLKFNSLILQSQSLQQSSMHDVRISNNLYTFVKVFVLFLFGFTIFVSSSHLGFAQTSKNIEEVRRQLEELNSEFESTQKKEKNISTNIDTLKNERENLNRLLITTADRIKKSEVTLSRIEAQLEELSVKEREVRKQMNKRYGKMADLLAVIQRMGRQPPPIMTAHRDDALRMVRTAMLLSSVFPQLKSKADKLAGDLTQLVTIIATTRTKAEQLRFETEQLTGKRQQLAGLLSSKKSKILSQQNELKVIREAAQRYANRAGSLKDLVKKLDREVAKKSKLGQYQKELAQGKTGLKSKVDPSTGKNIELVPSTPKAQLASLISPARIKPALSFEKTKGLLPLPVSGKRIKSFGTPNKYGGKAKGMTLETRDNGQVTSPSDGWIVYAGPFRSYGQLLIINAGGGYHILLAGMTKIDVTTGQFVLAGEPVATMGVNKPKSRRTRKTDETRLYVEFRKNGQPIDPDPWWIKETRKAQG